MTRAVFLCSSGCFHNPDAESESFQVGISIHSNLSEKSCDFSDNEINPCRKRVKN